MEGNIEIKLEDEDNIEKPHEDEVRKIWPLDIELACRGKPDVVLNKCNFDFQEEKAQPR